MNLAGGGGGGGGGEGRHSNQRNPKDDSFSGF